MSNARNLADLLDSNGDVKATALDNDPTTLTDLGVTATSAELNYIDGVTSNVQTQLDGKQSTLVAGTDYLTPTGDGSSLTGINTDLVSDTTPQLGGDLDTNGNAITGSTVAINSSNGEFMISATENGPVALRYDNNLKLTTKSDGVDITGELQADSLDIDGDGDITGNLTLGGNLNLGDNDKAQFGAGNDLQIYHSGSGSYISDQGVGPLNLLSGGVRLKDTTDTSTMLAANSGGAVTLYHNNSPKLATTSTGIDVTGRITTDGITEDTSGNVGIGTSSPTTPLHISTSGNTAATFHSTTDNSNLVFTDASTTANVAIGAVSGDNFRVQVNNAERMRIDSSGNLLVGTTNTSIATTSSESGTQITDGGINIAANNPVAQFNRINSNGAIVNFRRDGTTVGSIGVDVDGTNLMVSNGVVGLRFVEGSNQIRPANGDTGGNRDNAINLGYAASRFKDLYLSGGVYVGGTSSNNYLDDYEEGTWTNVLQAHSGSFSMNTNTGSYTKVGRLVFIQARVNISSISSASGIWYISLPFANISSSSKEYYGVISLITSGVDFGGKTNTGLSVEGSGVSRFYPLHYGSNTGWAVSNVSNLAAGDDIQFGGFYFTN